VRFTDPMAMVGKWSSEGTIKMRRVLLERGDGIGT
jgi:hypothetical protein